MMMIKPIVTDQFFLSQKAAPATEAHRSDAVDLLDTLNANRHRCVGMAANMIGVNRRIIAVNVCGIHVLMWNPVIKSRSKKTYCAEEGCLCHTGQRPVLRHEEITIAYEDLSGASHIQTFSGFTAQIIQHEMDHLDGILI